MDPLLETVNNPIAVNKVRERLVNDMTAHSDLYDESDLERVRSNDWTVKRFLVQSKGDEESALVMARDTMKWRKSFGINTRTDLDFPMEIYQIGAIFPYCDDKDERVVVYFRIKLHRTFPNFSDVVRQFIFHIIDKIDIQYGEKGFVMVWDLTGAGPSNWDLSMVRFVINSFHNHYSTGLKFIYLYGVPWIMNPFVNLALKLIPDVTRKKIIHISKDQIFGIIEPANVPDFIKDGKCDKGYREIPKGAKDAINMTKELGLTIQEVENILKYYANDLK